MCVYVYAPLKDVFQIRCGLKTHEHIVLLSFKHVKYCSHVHGYINS